MIDRDAAEAVATSMRLAHRTRTRLAGNRLPWYDSRWLEEYITTKEVLAGDDPESVLTFEDAFRFLRTRQDFGTREYPEFFGPDKLREMRSQIDALDVALVAHHEATRFGRQVVHNLEYFNKEQEALVEFVSDAVGEAVEPSYNFLALYQAQGRCSLHMDALDAKWTLDICIDQSDPWPLSISNVVPWPEDFVASPDWDQRILGSPDITFRQYLLNPGDALIFSGSSQWHHRGPQPGGPNGFCNLVFFHFVPRGGHNLSPAEWRLIHAD
jgi:hypothetical protein